MEGETRPASGAGGARRRQGRRRATLRGRGMRKRLGAAKRRWLVSRPAAVGLVLATARPAPRRTSGNVSRETLGFGYPSHLPHDPLHP
jgi:hypothetical protein